ncbi:SICAvar, type I [Plasmodium knowlesi strain H]|uniref:SICAvar, type I n=1 Tax=Plasmodium knowlesi (strain H) TaxID=5851 RepID=A0A1A7VQH4_PLAKH|nr:SICAvar, type I [Plasmodium knowlesi strain H]
MDLCKHFQCVSEGWLKQKKGNSGATLSASDWTDVWDEAKRELTELGKARTGKKGQFETYCTDLKEDKEGKEACLLIAAGLKSLYNITDNDPVKASFQRTMRCVLLNAIADKLLTLPCKDEKNVDKGINEAFTNKNSDIKRSTACAKDDKCFMCNRFKTLSTCTIKENSTSGDTNLKSKIDQMLEDRTLITTTSTSPLSKSSLTKTICKPCKENNFCGNLKCVINKWEERNSRKSTGTTTWDAMRNDVGEVLNELLNRMKDTAKWNRLTEYCNDSSWGNDAHGEANKTACKMVAAGLQHISSIQFEYDSSSNQNPYDKQEFQQFVSCLMLKAVVQKMKEQSPICYIEPGIKRAFESADKIKREKCTNKNPCIECKLEDLDQMNPCRISTKDNATVKTNVDQLLKDKDSEVKTALTPITEEKGNKGSTLCPRLQCLSARVKALSKEDDFWRKEGEVGQLWDALSKAMNANGGKDDNGVQCKTVDNGSGTGASANGRTATDPERKACNYLHAGFHKLKQLTSATTPQNKNGKILNENPLLKQAMGCFLLHAYAKKMKKDSKCVIDSGLKKAFDTAGQNLNGLQCKWDDRDYDNCQINTTDTNGKTTPTPAENKLTRVQDKINNAANDNLTEVNKMNKLCDYIKCAAPKWFKNNAPTSTGNSKPTWCDFWDKAVKDALKKMFEDMETKGKKTNDVCNDFGDGNEDSVERKACNHITAGLKYIKGIQPNGGSTNPLLDRAVGCIALNMYADQIIARTEDSCPIEEETIKQMFTKWNEKNNNNSSTSCQAGSGSNNNVCFKCTRQPNFNNCKLSVDSNLVNTQSGSCNNENNDKKDVQKQMNNLLEDKSQSNSINNTMQKTFFEITKMDHNFCTQLQCAAKKWSHSKTGKSSGVNWNALKEEIGKELTALLKDMNDATKQSAAEQYCKNDTNWNNKGHTERRTNRAACLHFAAGLQHIYGRGNGRVNGPSFGQTMGCLFLKEYAKQLKEMANKKKQGHSWVHPHCSIDKGIEYAFNQSKVIMNASSECKNTNGPNSCFECQLNDYNDCSIGTDNVKTNVGLMFKDQTKQNQMQETLENTVCPILLTDILTPFLPLAPVSIGLSVMAYYLWKYFGPLGKGGQPFRRSPTEIPGPSVQEQVLDHVEEAGPHEYRLVKERKPRSAPRRTKRSGPVNRRTIIEIHFEVLDECQKGDTQLNQKDFLELLVQEFMGSELMEEEQVPQEEVLMEGVPLE